MSREELLSNYIDDICKEKKPRILERLEEIDDEMLDLLETVRVIKRSYAQEGQKAKKVKPWRLMGIGIAAVLVFVLILGLEPFLLPQKGNIVHAVMRAYGHLNNYHGQVILKSFTKNELIFKEEVEIFYQKPWKYNAVHKFDGTTVHRISNGSEVVSLYSDMVEIDYLYPEKYLWRYHVGTTVWELEKAREIKQLGMEKVLGRDAYVIAYKTRKDGNYQKMWVDAETDLPLKKELTFSGNKKIVMEFTALEANTKINKKQFQITIPKGKNVKEWNELSSWETASNKWSWLAKMQQGLPSEMKLVKVGKNSQETFVLRYRSSEENYLDVLIMPRPESIRYLGENNKGFVQIKENDVKIYTTKGNRAQWVTKDYQAIFITTKDISFLKKLLEPLVEEGTEFNCPQLKK